MKACENCRICGAGILTVAYSNQIRSGRFGSQTSDVVHVLRCQSCEAESIPSAALTNYESDDYRQAVDGSSQVSDYYKNHDWEQLRHLQMCRVDDLRGKVLMDVGCGGGAFLDFVRGVIARGIAIEPSETFRKSLVDRGYSTYAYLENASEREENQIDVAVSFSVIEHIEDPLQFLRQMKPLLKSKGTLVLSTPNLNDVLMDTLPEVYKPFFYRTAHLWYFNSKSLTVLLEKAGYKNIEVTHYQRYGLSNYLYWLRDKKPSGLKNFPFVSQSAEALWKAELERQGVSDYLVARASV